MPKDGLIAIAGIKVGHHTLEDRTLKDHPTTGCTVILTETGATAAVDVRGASPGTRETALLDPRNSIQQVHAVVLSGGSAFGLAAADGVMSYLANRGVGYRTRAARVPIVPAAILYDLGVGDPDVRPGANCGIEAARNAQEAYELEHRIIDEGSVGAGAGATVGKLAGPGRAMKGGVGTALIELRDGLQVAALMVVNAVGDVHDPATGDLIAGVLSEDGRRLVGAGALLREPVPDTPGENTTIGVVATNALLDKAQLGVVARMAHDGLARAVRPAHTPVDGDTIFALATGLWPPHAEVLRMASLTTVADRPPYTRNPSADLLRIGALAAEVTAEAIVRGVRAARGLPGYPAVRDLEESTP